MSGVSAKRASARIKQLYKGKKMFHLFTKFWGYFTIKTMLCLGGYAVTVLQGAPSQTLLIVGSLSALAIPLFYYFGE
jgi:hypothetical protein